MSESSGYVDRAKKNTIVFKPKRESVLVPENKIQTEVKAVPAKPKASKPIKAEKPIEQKVVMPAPAPTPVVTPEPVKVEKTAEVTKPKGRIIFEKGSPEAVQWGKEMALRRKLAKEAKAKQTVVEVKQ